MRVKENTMLLWNSTTSPQLPIPPHQRTIATLQYTSSINIGSYNALWLIQGIKLSDMEGEDARLIDALGHCVDDGF